MWVNLHRHILEEFAAFSRVGVQRDFAYRLRPVEPSEKRDRWAHARALVMKSRRLKKARVALAATRPPCPQCGGEVTRLGTTGTLPKFCTPKCMRAAKWARWAEKNRGGKVAA